MPKAIQELVVRCLISQYCDSGQTPTVKHMYRSSYTLLVNECANKDTFTDTSIAQSYIHEKTLNAPSDESTHIMFLETPHLKHHTPSTHIITPLTRLCTETPML